VAKNLPVGHQIFAVPVMPAPVVVGIRIDEADQQGRHRRVRRGSTLAALHRLSPGVAPDWRAESSACSCRSASRGRRGQSKRLTAAFAAVLVAEPATVSLRHEAITDRLEASRTPPTAQASPRPRDRLHPAESEVEAPDLELLVRVGREVTYFCSP